MESPIPLLAIQEGKRVRDQDPGCPRGCTHLQPQPVRQARAQAAMVFRDQNPGCPQGHTRGRTNIRQGLLYRWIEYSADFSFLNYHWGREKGPQITLQG